jgi:hypothetical protein
MNNDKFGNDLKGQKCKNCLENKHKKCIAWTCQCKFCVRTIEAQREKTLRLEKYWFQKERKNKSKDENRYKTRDGRIKPRALSQNYEAFLDNTENGDSY